ncbi:MAG: sulfatase-like hydrolase/transferase [Verrucomicrobiales bacterium]|nr:sulfatase-like hydrolase/transferase [Verrucomicrobiales bacterium]
MHRILTLFCGLLLSPFLALPIFAEKPNIIFILTDDLGYGDVGVLFQKQREGVQIKTPELDQMAMNGTIMNRHYCPAPICAPSRASLITGMHQGHSNVRNMQFDKAIEDNWNFANTLQKAGYYTIHLGKYGLQGWGHSPEKWAGYPTKRGFDYFYGYVRHVDGHQHYPANFWKLGDNKSHQQKKQVWENNTEVSAGLDKCYTTDLWTAKAKQMIIEETKNNPKRPFFMYLAYDTPHAALQLPTVAYPGGKGVNGGLKWLGRSGKMINTAEGTIDHYRDPHYTDKDMTDLAERFATSITRIDHCVGDLLQTLKDLKIDKNTIVIFSSDNGPHRESYIKGKRWSPSVFQSAGKFKGSKGSSYEGGLRVPTFAWGPSRIKAGQKSNAPSQFHDWMATFCDYAGVNAPARIDGVSLVPTLNQVGKQKKGIVYVEFNNQQGLYLDGYKGLRMKATGHAVDFEIFNTLDDGPESKNLAGTNVNFNRLQKRMKNEVLRIRMPNKHAKKSYDGELVPGLDISKKNLRNGVGVKTYLGKWDWVPEFTQMSSEASSFEKNIDVESLPAEKNAGLLFSGYIHIPEPGDWKFHCEASGGLIFKIHNKLVIDGDYKYDGTEISTTLKLDQGIHPYRLYYKTSSNKPSLGLQWEGPSVAKGSIPANALLVQGEQKR